MTAKNWKQAEWMNKETMARSENRISWSLLNAQEEFVMTYKISAS